MEPISNKSLVLNFYREVIRDRNTDLVDAYISDNYIQHNPMIPDGKAGIKMAIEYLKQMPKAENQENPIVAAIAEGDYVMLLMDLEIMEKRQLVADLFRIEAGKIKEHWDAIQILSDEENEALEKAPFQQIEASVSIEANKSLVKQKFDDQELNSSSRTIDEAHRIIGEGNLVGVQSSGKKEGLAFVFYDLFRIADGKIAQHWTVEQVIPETMAHGNGMI